MNYKNKKILIKNLFFLIVYNIKKMVKKKTCHCKTGGFKISNLLGPLGAPLRLVGLGRRGSALKVSGNALRVSGNRGYRGGSMWGDMLGQTIDMWGRQGLNELGRLARKV